MYRITSNSTFVGYAESVVLIRYHPDGFDILCEKSEADGFCAKMAVTITD